MKGHRNKNMAISSLTTVLLAGCFLSWSIRTMAADRAAKPIEKDLQALACASVVGPINRVVYWGDPDFRIYDSVYGDGATKSLGISERTSSKDHGDIFSEKFTPIADRIRYRLSLIRNPLDSLPRYQTGAVISVLVGLKLLSGSLVDEDDGKSGNESAEEIAAKIRKEKFGADGATQFCYVSVKIVNANAVISERCGIFFDRLWKDEEAFSVTSVEIVPRKDAVSVIEATSLDLISQLQTRWAACSTIGGR